MEEMRSFRLLNEISEALPEWELILVFHESIDARKRHPRLLQGLPKNCRVVPIHGKFNFSRFANLGIDASTGEVIILMNDDITVSDYQRLRELADACQDTSQGGFFGVRLHDAKGELSHDGVSLGFFRGARNIREPIPVTELSKVPGFHHARKVAAVTFALVGFRRDTVYTCGLLDENLPYGLQDVDICLKANALGFDNYCLDVGEVVHLEGATRGNPRALKNWWVTLRDTLVFRKRHLLLRGNLSNPLV